MGKLIPGANYRDLLAHVAEAPPGRPHHLVVRRA
jgi:hypothetical protein